MNRLVLKGVAPSINHMYRNAFIKGVGGRTMRVLTKTAAIWKDQTVTAALVWRKKNNWETPDKGVKVIVRAWFFFPDKRKRDTHNTLKLLLDCFEDAGLYQNDQYALPHVMDFVIDRENPRIEFEFEVLTHAENQQPSADPPKENGRNIRKS